MSASHPTLVLRPCGIWDLRSTFKLLLVLSVECSKSWWFWIIHFKVKLLMEIRISNILILRWVQKINIVPKVVIIAEILSFLSNFTNIAIFKFLNRFTSFQNGLLILVTEQPNFSVVLQNFREVVLDFLPILVLMKAHSCWLFFCESLLNAVHLLRDLFHYSFIQVLRSIELVFVVFLHVVLLKFLFKVTFSQFTEDAPQILNPIMWCLNHGERFVLSNVVRRLFVEGPPQVTRTVNCVREARHRDWAG